MKNTEFNAAVEAAYALVKMRIPTLDESDQALFQIAFAEGANFIIQQLKETL